MSEILLPPNPEIAASGMPPMGAEAGAKWMEELARRELLRRDFLAYVRSSHPHYYPGWVHFDIARRIQKFVKDVEQRKRPRLMLLMPPRHGKSELLSVRFPAWVLGLHSTWKFILTSYNQDLPLEFSRQVRAQISEKSYQGIFDTRLDPLERSAENWKTTTQGGLYAASLLSGLSGKGARILVVDDPVKNQEEADSITIREKIWEQFTSSAMTRLDPGGGILVVQTWWHDDDLAGRLQRMMSENPKADQYEVVRYPALSTHYEYYDTLTQEIIHEESELSQQEVEDQGFLLQRIPGDALHPERYSSDDLNAIRENMPPRIWSALYQQNPVPDGGNYFDSADFRTVAKLPELNEESRIFTAWDFAIGEKQQNDFTVGATIDYSPTGVLGVRHISRMKVGTFKIVKAIVDEAEKWMSMSPYYTVGVEDGHIWRTLEPLLRQYMLERNVHFPIVVLKPLTDKLVRARPLQGKIEQGKVVFLAHPRWWPIVKQEMTRFPAAVHDDCVDALSWVARMAIDRAPPRIRTPAKKQRQKYGGLTLKDRIRRAMIGTGNGGHMSA